MPVFEILTSEIILTKYHIDAETEEDALENIHKGTVVSQKVTYPDIEDIGLVE